MKFYAVHEGFYEGVQDRIDLLQSACEKKAVEFVCINSLNFDHTNIPQLTKRDLLYNISSGSQTLISLLLTPAVTTFYINNPDLNLISSTTEWSILHQKASLPAPKTIFHISPNRDLLKVYTDYLGGFPLIIKVCGGSRGIGTIKIDSWQSLISTIDFLATTKDKFILREFIKAKSGCRMIVLGDQVIAAADFAMQENDFRNAIIASQIKYERREYAEKVKNLAIKATHLANLEFGGVDLLEDEAGNYHLLEVNFPTGFIGLIDVCKVDIPGLMVDYLINKANNQCNGLKIK